MEWHKGRDLSVGFNGWTHLVHSMCGWLVILLHAWYLLWWKWLV